MDETNRYDEMRQQRGIEYEQDWVRAHYPEAVRITPDFGFEALRNTLQAGQLTRDNLLDVFIDSQEFASQASFLPPLDPVTAFVTTLDVRILGKRS